MLPLRNVIAIMDLKDNDDLPIFAVRYITGSTTADSQGKFLFCFVELGPLVYSFNFI